MTLASVLTLIRIFSYPSLTLLLENTLRCLLGYRCLYHSRHHRRLDGYAARARQEVSKFGQLMDPVADKLLVSSAIIAMVELGQVSAWVAVLILGREFAVSGLRLVVAVEGVVIPASRWGKLKTVSQVVAIAAMLIQLPGAEYLLWMAVLLTVASGIDYFLKAQPYLH